MKPQTDAQEKAMRIAYAYSQNPQSAAELLQAMIDGAVKDRRGEILEALEDLLGDMPDVQDGQCVRCGRDYPDGTANNICPSDDCPSFKARAAIRKARGTE